ncbi:MAG: outer membrane lipoprotein carrier protein LolA [Magnetovibrio sp.]|nr:outer membrane lipoprotein carrier protein LolA [Magnetovibrio sp.]
MSAQPNPIDDQEPVLTPIPNRAFPLGRVVGGLLVVALMTAAAAVMLPKSAEAKDAIGLNTSQKKTIEHIQTYLNAITTMRSRFMQITSEGGFSQGDFRLQRPGLMRIDYDPPVPVLIVSNGLMVMYKDEELDQISHVPLATMPASMFIGDTVDFFGDDLLITDFSNIDGVLRLTIQRSEDPLEGSLTLMFETKPLALKKWTVIDGQGINTTVSLLGPKFGESFDPQLFKVENRAMGGVDN